LRNRLVLRKPNICCKLFPGEKNAWCSKNNSSQATPGSVSFFSCSWKA
jgi:hypothetical protein